MNVSSRLLAAAAPLVAAALLAWAPPATAADLPKLSVDEVSKLVGAPDVRIYDVNAREVFDKAHLPGATFVELAGSDVEQKLPKDRKTRLVYYCKNPH